MNNILCQEIHNAYISGDDKMLQKLWDKDAPSTLIKFFPATYEPNGTNYFLDHIENEEIWLSSPLRFNDPFDCVYNYMFLMLLVKQIYMFLYANCFPHKTLPSCPC